MWLSAKLRALQQMQQLPPQLPPLLLSCKCQRQRLESRSHCARARRQLQHTPMCKVVRPVALISSDSWPLLEAVSVDTIQLPHHRQRGATACPRACNMSHSGDKVPDYDFEAHRFGHHTRAWASWERTASMGQAASCAIAVAPHGGAWHAAKAEMRAEHKASRAAQGASDAPQGGMLPGPAPAAWQGRMVALHTSNPMLGDPCSNNPFTIGK